MVSSYSAVWLVVSGCSAVRCGWLVVAVVCGGVFFALLCYVVVVVGVVCCCGECWWLSRSWSWW